jgi:hypothetical protein
METFNAQQNREKRQNNIIRKWGKRNGLSNSEIQSQINKAHARRGSRNANLTVGAIKRKWGSSRKTLKRKSKAT